MNNLPSRDKHADVPEVEGVTYVEQIEKYRRDAIEASQVEVLQPERNTPGGLRRAKQKSMDPMPILKGISAAFTADEITAALRTAMDLAISTNSVEDIMRVVRFVTSYQVGTPVKRSISAHYDKADMAALFADNPVDNGEETV
jgi:hypothetical protein